MVPKISQYLSREEALPGRATPASIHNKHIILQTPLQPPFPQAMDSIIFGMGCFWGVERKFWQVDGVYTTAVGYAAGYTENPSYEEVCSGLTGHNEVVLVVYDTNKVSAMDLLTVFWQSHNPTQGMRQGNDIGTQYRSGIYYTTGEQKQLAFETMAAYQQKLSTLQIGDITTEILPAPQFYYAEDYHQQYLAKNPMGYCGLQGTGLSLF